jgi:hypothetical protein
MSLTGAFNTHTVEQTRTPPHRSKRLAPFSLRLTETERARLVAEAGGMPLGAYIKAKALGDPPLRKRQTGHTVADRAALGQVLALLGRSELAGNLSRIAHAAAIGSLPMTPETEAALQESLFAVRDMRLTLLAALGLKPGGAP